MKSNLAARMTAEFLGTAFLLAAVVGSGIMGERLAGGNVAIALLAISAEAYPLCGNDGHTTPCPSCYFRAVNRICQ